MQVVLLLSLNSLGLTGEGFDPDYVEKANWFLLGIQIPFWVHLIKISWENCNHCRVLAAGDYN